MPQADTTDWNSILKYLTNCIRAVFHHNQVDKYIIQRGITWQNEGSFYKRVYIFLMASFSWSWHFYFYKSQRHDRCNIYKYGNNVHIFNPAKKLSIYDGVLWFIVCEFHASVSLDSCFILKLTILIKDTFTWVWQHKNAFLLKNGTVFGAMYTYTRQNRW